MNRHVNAKVIDAGAMTGTAVVTGKALHIPNCSRVSFQAVWTGTPNGTVSVETSDHPQAVLSDGSYNATAAWSVLVLPTAYSSGQPAGAAGNFDFYLADIGALWIRPKYTNSSSTGTLNVWGTAKP